MKLRVLYFARLRERLGVSEEALTFDGTTAADLIAQLGARGGVWADELGAERVFRIAVNQVIVPREVVLEEGAEVAIFPPVTGG